MNNNAILSFTDEYVDVSYNIEDAGENLYEIGVAFARALIAASWSPEQVARMFSEDFLPDFLEPYEVDEDEEEVEL